LRIVGDKVVNALLVYTCTVYM